MYCIVVRKQPELEREVGFAQYAASKRLESFAFAAERINSASME